ncbi:hypothetical protein AAZV13_20G190300 [Glycine max]
MPGKYFQVKKKQFFKNFTTILLFGVVGTVVSFCLISVGALLLIQRIGISNLDIKDYLAIGVILSATDSVCTLQIEGNKANADDAIKLDREGYVSETNATNMVCCQLCL